MASHPDTYGAIALTVGIAAIVLTGGFFFLNGGFAPVGPSSVDPVADRGLLITYIVIAYLFQFGTPLLCCATFLFRLPRKGFWTAKLGIVLATASLLIYVLTLRACFQLIS